MDKAGISKTKDKLFCTHVPTCVPGCGMAANCTCVLTSFDTICAATSVNIMRLLLLQTQACSHSVPNITTLCISIVMKVLAVPCVVWYNCRHCVHFLAGFGKAIVTRHFFENDIPGAWFFSGPTFIGISIIKKGISDT